MRGTWQTTGGSAGGPALAVVVLAAALIAAPVITAVAHLVAAVAVLVFAVDGLALTGVAALVAIRLRRGPGTAPAGRANPIRVTHLPPAARPAESLLAPQPRAIEGPREVHLHFHGVTPEEIAAIIARQKGE